MKVIEVPNTKPDIVIRLTHDEAKALKWALQCVRFEHDIRYPKDAWTRTGRQASRATTCRLDDALAEMHITSVWKTGE